MVDVVGEHDVGGIEDRVDVEQADARHEVAPSQAACTRSTPSSTPACQVPGAVRESVPQQAASLGTPQWWASSVARKRQRPSSGKLTKAPVRGSA